VCGEAANGTEAVEKARELSPDLVILDISMLPHGGLKPAKQIIELLPEVLILLLSVYEGRTFAAIAKSVGVRGFVRKDQIGSELLKAVDAVLRGQPVFPE
jgi:two-component system response regulator NreC